MKSFACYLVINDRRCLSIFFCVECLRTICNAFDFYPWILSVFLFVVEYDISSWYGFANCVISVSLHRCIDLLLYSIRGIASSITVLTWVFFGCVCRSHSSRTWSTVGTAVNKSFTIFPWLNQVMFVLLVSYVMPMTCHVETPNSPANSMNWLLKRWWFDGADGLWRLHFLCFFQFPLFDSVVGQYCIPRRLLFLFGSNNCAHVKQKISLKYWSDRSSPWNEDEWYLHWICRELNNASVSHAARSIRNPSIILFDTLTLSRMLEEITETELSDDEKGDNQMATSNDIFWSNRIKELDWSSTLRHWTSVIDDIQLQDSSHHGQMYNRHRINDERRLALSTERFLIYSSSAYRVILSCLTSNM